MNDRNTEVLEQYELEVFEVRRGRGAFLCETDQGLKLLREYRGTVRRLEFEHQVLSQIQGQRKLLTDQYVKTKEDNLISIADDGSRYILKDWFQERECDLKSEREIEKAVAGMAMLHSLLRQVEIQEEWNLGSILARPMEQEMERHNRELKRVRNYIRGKQKKTEFELCVIGNFEMFFSQALEARQGLLALNAEQEGCYLCHGDMNQHHVMTGGSFIAFTEFSKMHMGVQMEDLYHFMRKVMEKHNWNSQLGASMLEVYERVMPLSDIDKKYLYYLFLYPEKYWKQINFYYNSNKAWMPSKNIVKLKNLEEQFQNREQFLLKIK